MLRYPGQVKYRDFCQLKIATLVTGTQSIMRLDNVQKKSIANKVRSAQNEICANNRGPIMRRLCQRHPPKRT